MAISLIGTDLDGRATRVSHEKHRNSTLCFGRDQAMKPNVPGPSLHEVKTTPCIEGPILWTSAYLGSA